MRPLFFTSIIWLALLIPISQAQETTSSFEKATKGLSHQVGFFDLYTSSKSGKILAKLPAPDSDGTMLRFIHAARLSAGLGSNPLGLDRGWGNAGQLLRFRRIGGKVIAEVENHRYRAVTDNGLERTAVAASFANSFIWSTTIIAVAPDGDILVDLSGLLTMDMLGLAQAMDEQGAGFSQAKDRSLVDLSSTLVFQDNVEVDTFMTFTSKRPGAEVQATAANANAVTLIQHHSFVRLPDAGYQTRQADPRTGTFALGFYDYASPLSQPVLNGVVMRHRLQRTDRNDPNSPIKEPLVFYIDSGAPALIRTALQEGASWWSEAFEAAGFPGGFRVEILPENAHPLDIRYNVVQWVHRQTRGWSYGGGIIDPRTGEMIKGHVILGSQRVRQDRMIFEGLAGVEHTDSGRADDPVQLALSRIRQLAAHEVGHSLGFGHNFAASMNDRASVMDYPAPWVKANSDDQLDFSSAYDTGIGAWDIHTARWLYGEFADNEDEASVLSELISQARQAGLLYVSDPDARSVGTAHPKGAVWDNGNDAVDELNNVLEVRRIALNNFDIDQIMEGRRLSDLREVLTPIYLYHRYQIAAAAKSLGGLSFNYELRRSLNDQQSTTRPVSAEQQRRALAALLRTLNPAALDLSEQVLNWLSPPHDSYWFNVTDETIASRATPAFDLFAAAETAADLSFSALLHPQRAERLVQFHARDNQLPGLNEVLSAIEVAIFDAVVDTSRQRAIAQVIQGRYVFALLNLDTSTASQLVRARSSAKLKALEQQLRSTTRRRANRNDVTSNAHRLWLADRIQTHLARPSESEAAYIQGPETPPGSPIGAVTAEACWHCE